MNRNTWLGIILLIVVFVGIALIDAGVKKPIDWRESYLFSDKIPFGTYVFREEIPNILGKDRKYTNFGESFYELLSMRDATEFEDTAIIDIYGNQSSYGEDTESVLDFVENGGEAFLCGKSFSREFLDSLGVQINELDFAKFRPTARSVFYTLGHDTARVYLDKVSNFSVFSKLDPQKTIILGELHCRGRAMPNFVQINHGKGKLYLYLVPAAFSNFYMLQENTFYYAVKAISVIKSKDIWLSDYGYHWEEPRTPLRVILKNPGFAQAWYLLLIGLVLLLIFKSKREQRSVPVVLPEANKSKEFAQTIGNLYYENGSPGNIIQKKIEYFLYDIRNNYQLDTLKLDDERFIKQLSSKAGVEFEETRYLLRMIEFYRKKNNASIPDVKLVNQKIEEFKRKANFI